MNTSKEKILACGTHDYLSLAEKHLTDEDLLFVTEAIREKQCISLDLTDNLFTSCGVRILVEELKTNQTLKVLILNRNELDDKSMEYLTDLLEDNNRTLEELQLRETNITNHGVQFFADRFRTNSVLKYLDLGHNFSITDACVESLLRMYERIQTYPSLSLSYCYLTEHAKEVLYQAAKKKNALLELKDYNQSSSDSSDSESYSDDSNEDLRLIWLEENMDDGVSWSRSQEMLRDLNAAALFFSNISLTLDYIQSAANEQILLIVSKDLAEEILARTRSIRAVQAVFIFCEDPFDGENLSKNYPSLAGVFTEQSKLRTKIMEVQHLIQKQVLVFSIFDQKQKSIRDLTKESTDFLWQQVLFYILHRMPADALAKKEMLQICETFYRHSRKELNNIEQFRFTDRVDQVIEWYTKDSFVFKLVNKALRSEDMVLMYQFRYLIIRLSEQLAIEHGKMQPGERVTLYRGQRISVEELEKIRTNVGSLISMNTFLSTTYDRAVGLMFTPRHQATDELITGVLFEIQVDTNAANSLVFADITMLSHYPTEREILFGCGSTFKIASCELDHEESVWVVTLHASDEGSDRLREFIKIADDQMQIESEVIYYGNILYNKLCRRDQAIQYFKTVRKVFPPKSINQAIIYERLGDLYGLSSGYGAQAGAIRYALSIHSELTYEDDCEDLSGTDDENVDNLIKKLHEEELANPGNSLQKAKLLLEIGNISEEYNDSISWTSRSLAMYIKLLPPQHPTVARCVESLGTSYLLKGDYNQALLYHIRALEIEESYSLPQSRSLHMLIDRIIFSYENKGEHDIALKFCRQKFNSLIDQYGEQHSAVLYLCKCIDNLMASTESFERNEYQYLSKLNCCPLEDLHLKKTLLSKLRTLYRDHCLMLKCIDISKQELELSRSCHGANAPEVAFILQEIGYCYFHMHEYNHALYYKKEALRTYQCNLDLDSLHCQNCLEMILRIENKAKEENIDISTTNFETSE